MEFISKVVDGLFCWENTLFNDNSSSLLFCFVGDETGTVAGVRFTVDWLGVTTGAGSLKTASQLLSAFEFEATVDAIKSPNKSEFDETLAAFEVLVLVGKSFNIVK